MPDLIIILIPGIFTPDQPQTWHNEGAVWLVDHGIVEDGNAMPFGYWADTTAPFIDSTLARKLYSIMDEDFRDAATEGHDVVFDLAAHSNGCKVLLALLQKYPAINVRNIHLFAAADLDDCDSNGLNAAIERGQITGMVYFYCSPNDEFLGIGSMMGFGLLGKIGPTHESGKLTIKSRVVWRKCGHNDWVEKYFGESMQAVADAAAGTLGGG